MIQQILDDEDFKKLDVIRKMDLEGEKKDWKTLNKAFWLGKDVDVDTSIVNYLKSGLNSAFGVPYHNLVCRFVYEFQIMSEQRLKKRLQTLKKTGWIETYNLNNAVFFKVLKEEKE